MVEHQIKINTLLRHCYPVICRKKHTRQRAHYENMPIQINWKFYHKKKKKKSHKNTYIFHISTQNIDCEYSLERRGGSNEYTHNLWFWAEIRKIIYTPVNPSFAI